MLFRLLTTGLIAGAVAGVLVTLVHLAMVTPLILEAEVYEEEATAAAIVARGESAAHTHENGVIHEHAGGGIAHVHDVHQHADGEAHVHDPEDWSPADGFERNAFTLLANLIMSVAFAFILGTALMLYGRSIGPVEGILWGGAGFLAFSFLPAIGLPPELPGAHAADLVGRQAWWLGTAFASAVGLGLLILVKPVWFKVLGAVLLAVPHLIGAPHPLSGGAGEAPPELAAQFVMATLFGAFVMWLVIGSVTGYVQTWFRGREEAQAGALAPQ